MSKKTAILDLTGCKYLGELHKRIKEALDFPEHYGENWSAFWDCINCDCEIQFLSVIGTQTISEDLKPSIIKMTEILERNKKYWENSDYSFDYEVLN